MKPGHKKKEWFPIKTGLLDNLYAKSPPLKMKPPPKGNLFTN